MPDRNTTRRTLLGGLASGGAVLGGSAVATAGLWTAVGSTDGTAQTATGGDPDSRSNTLVIRGNGEPVVSEYTVSVSGGLTRSGELGSLDGADSVTGGEADGSVWGGGVDGYRYSGAIRSFEFEGPATVLRNGTVVDPETLGGEPSLPHSLLIEGTGEQVKSSYTFSVTGELHRSAELGSLDGADSVSGSTATGAVWGPGADGYRFDGELGPLEVSGPARAYLDGSELNPDECTKMFQRVRPDRSVAVAPDETTRFTVTIPGVEPGEWVNEVEWSIDGTTAVPERNQLVQAYRYAENVEFLETTFTEPGTHVVTASHPGSDGNQSQVRWNVTVEATGNEAPTTTLVSPDPIKTIQQGDTVEFTLEANGPERELEKAVFFETPSDFSIDIESLAGRCDTATVTRTYEDIAINSVDVFAWVIDDAGGRTTTESWRVDIE